MTRICTHRPDRVRHRLALGTALPLALAVMVAAPATVRAQIVPSVSNAGGTSISASNGGRTLTVAISNPNPIVEWSSFSIGGAGEGGCGGGGCSVIFTESVPGSTAILNRVTGGSASTLNGTMTANGIEVWLVNPNGILLGANANINTGGLVLSTADIANADFLDGGAFTLAAPLLSSTAISGGGAGTQVRTNGGILLVQAARINLNGQFDATDGANPAGNVAFVTATEASYTPTAGAPLSIVLEAGTSVTSDMVVDGTVSGRNLQFAMLTEALALSRLLDVRADLVATQASATDRGIILAAGDGISVGGGIITNDAGLLPALQPVGISLSGTITTTGSDSNLLAGASGRIETSGAAKAVAGQVDLRAGTTVDLQSDLSAGSSIIVENGDGLLATRGLTAGTTIDILADGNAAIGSALSTGNQAISLSSVDGDVTVGDIAGGAVALVAANGTVNATGDVTAAGDYLIVAERVNLGDGTLSGGSDLQQATGTIDITATAGTIDGVTGLILRSNSSDAAAANPLILDASGGLDFAAGARLEGGANQSADLALRIGAGQPVQLGDVSARALVETDATHAVFTAGLTHNANVSGDDLAFDDALAVTLTAGAIDFGNVTVTNGDLTLDAPGSVTLGDADVGGAVTLASGSTVTGGALVAAGAIGATATGAIILGSARSNGGGGITLAAGSALTIGDVFGGTIDLAAGTVTTVNGDVTAAGDYLVRGASVVLGDGTVTGGSDLQQATGLVDVTATSGTVAGGANLILRSNSDGVGTERLIVDGEGGLAFAASSRLQGGPARQSDVALRAGNGQTIVVGDVAARELVEADAAHAVFTGGVSHDADMTFGTITTSLGLTLTGANNVRITTGDITVTDPGQILTINSFLPGGSISTGDLSADRTVLVRGELDVTTGSVTSLSDDVILVSEGEDVTAGALSAANLVSVSAFRDVRITKVDAGGAAGVGALRDIFADEVTAAGAVSMNAGRSLGANLAPALTVESTGSNVALTAGLGALSADSISAATLASAVGNSVSIGTISSGGDALVRATGGGATLDRFLAVGDDATLEASALASLSGTSSIDGALTVTGNAVALGVDAGNETIAADGAITISSTGGGIAGGAGLTLQGDADGLGGERILLDGIGGIVFDPGATILGGPSAANLTAPLVISAGTGALTLGTVRAEALLGTPDLLITQPLSLAGAVIVTGPLVTDQAVAINAASIETGAVTSNLGGITLTAFAGDLSVASATSTLAAIALGASGTASVGTIDGVGVSIVAAGVEQIAPGNGDVDSSAGLLIDGGAGAVLLDRVDGTNGVTVLGAGIALGDVTDTGGNIVIQSTLGATAGTVTADAGSITMSAANGNAAATRFVTSAGQAASLSATGGSAILGTADVGGTLSLSAGGPGANRTAALTGNATVGGDLILLGQRVELGNDADAEAISAAGFIDATATAGDLIGGAGLTLTAGSGGNPFGPLYTEASGNILFDATSSIVANSGFGVRLGTGGDLQLGTVTALRIASTGAGLGNGRTVDANLALTGDILATGLVTLNAAQEMVTSNGSISLADVVMNNNAALTLRTTGGTGAIGFDDLASGGSVTIAAVGAVTGDTIVAASAGGSTGITGTGITLSTVTGNAGAVSIDGTGNVQLTNVTTSGAGAAVLIDADGTLTVADVTSSAALTLGSAATDSIAISGTAQGAGLVDVNTAGLADIATLVSAGGAIDADVGSANLGTVRTTPGTGAIDITATAGDIDIDSLLGGGAVSLFANSVAGQDVIVAAGSVAGVTTIRTTADIDLGDPGPFTTQGLDLLAGGTVTLANVVATDVIVTGADIDLATIAATGDLSLTSTVGNVQVGTATAGSGAGDLLRIVSAADVLATNLTGGGVEVHADSGLADIDSITAQAANVTLTANAAQLGSVTAPAGAISIVTDAGTATATSLAAGTTLTVSATGGDVVIGDFATAGGALSLTSTTGNVSVANATTGGSVALTANSGAVGVGDVSATAGDVIVSANSATLDAVDASGAVGITTDAGTATATSLAAGTTLTVSATGGDVAITDFATAGGALSLTSTTGNVSVANATTGGSVALTANSGTVGVGDVSATAGDVIVSANSATLDAVDASGAVGITTDAGSATATSLAAGTTLTVSATGGDVVITDFATAGGALSLTSTTGNISVANATTGGSVALTANSGTVGVGDVSATAGDVIVAANSATLDAVDASGAVGITTDAGTATATSLAAGTTLTVGATGGDVVIIDFATAGGALSLTSSTDNVSVANATTGGSVALTADSGTVGVGEVSATAGDVIVSANGATLGAVDASGAVGITTDAGTATATSLAAGTTLTVSATGGDVVIGDIATAGGALSFTSTTGNISVANATTGGSVALTADSGAVSTGAVSATAGAVTVSADAATLGAVAAAGAAGSIAITLDNGDLILGSADAATTLTLDVGERLIDFGGGAAGTSAAFVASDIELGGGFATPDLSVTVADPALGMALGDGVPGGGLALSDAELALLSVTTLTLDAGTGPVGIGQLDLAAGTGATRFDLLTTGRIDLNGVMSVQGSGRTVRLGGTSDAAGRAALFVATTDPAAGGRIRAAGNIVELRAQRIAFGLASLIDALDLIGSGTGISPTDAAANFVGNSSSQLYNPLLGGSAYSDTDILVADRLVVRFGDYALFQNSAAPGLTAGVVLGGSGNPALVADGSGSAGSDAFALFGTINNVDGTAAALLGPAVNQVTDADTANARINGCLIGSGAGCLTTVVVQPTQGVFDVTRADVLRVAADFDLPFDPVIGVNNEALFADIFAGAADRAAADSCSPGEGRDCPDAAPATPVPSGTESGPDAP